MISLLLSLALLAWRRPRFFLLMVGLLAFGSVQLIRVRLRRPYRRPSTIVEETVLPRAA